MTGGKRSHEYGSDDNHSKTLELLNEAIAGYRSPYWEGRDDHKATLTRLEAARDELMKEQGPANTNQFGVVSGDNAAAFTQEQSVECGASPLDKARERNNTPEAKAARSAQQAFDRARQRNDFER
jgi:hypothetical protein